MLKRSDDRQLYRDKLRQDCWRAAESVAAAAFELAIREAYRGRNTALPVPELVAGMRTFFSSDGVNRIPQAEGELLVRAALGESVSVAAIPQATAFIVQGLIFVGVAWDLRYSDLEVDTILRRAEEIAAARGFLPTVES